MSVSDATREFVRRRASYGCEYCGLREQDVSGHLTVDHFQPLSKGGSDSVENLVYCCIWCNQHKLDYWPQQKDDIPLWHPRTSDHSTHFLLLEDGLLQPITECGSFTIRRLQLNRSALIAYRQRQQMVHDQSDLLAYYRDLASVQNRLIKQLTKLTEEQQHLLKEQQYLLQLLFRRS